MIDVRPKYQEYIEREFSQDGFVSLPRHQPGSRPAAFWIRQLEGLALVLPVSLDAAAASGVEPDAHLLVDADLVSVDLIQKLIPILAHRPGAGAQRIFALDPGALRDHLQADILGATAKIPRDARPVEIVAALTGAALPFPSSSFGAETPRLRDGLATGSAVADLILSGRRIDRLLIETATAEMASVVEEEGIARWIEAVRRHHEGTSEHCLLVSGLALAFAAHLGFRRSDRQMVGVAAALHDIGKARTPLELLRKEGALTPEEQATMRRHPVDGYAMLLEFGGYEGPVLRAVLHHHERLDGRAIPWASTPAPSMT